MHQKTDVSQLVFSVTVNDGFSDIGKKLLQLYKHSTILRYVHMLPIQNHR